MAARTDRSLRTACELLTSQARAVMHSPAGLGRVQLARVVILLDDLLACLPNPTTTRPIEWAELLRRRSSDHHELDELTRDLSRSVGGTTVANIARSRLASLTSALAGDLPVSVQTRWGAVRLSDLVRATLLELVVIALSTHPTDAQPAALRDSARSLCQALGARHPGQTIEVRVPPAAAVQVGAFGQGPTHTRGTPPNVAETNERTWVALATGLLDWATATEGGLVSASGSHVDELARMLPVADLAHLA